MIRSTRVNRKPVMDSKVESDSSDFEDAYDYETTDDSSIGCCSSSSPSSEGERTEVDDSDNDSGFVGVSQGSLDRLDTLLTDVTSEINGSQTTERKTTYDREAIIDKLIDAAGTYEYHVLVSVERMRRGESPSNIEEDCYPAYLDDNIPIEIQRERIRERIREAFKAIPDSLLHFVTGRHRVGDCERPFDQKPEWLDMEKFRRGQKFAQDHMFAVYFGEMISLFGLFSFHDGLKPLIITEKSHTPFAAFKRYLSTGIRIRNWYTEDPWKKGSLARKDLLTVKAMHAAVRRKLAITTNEDINAAGKIEDAWCPMRETLLKDFAEACEAPEIGQCAYAALKDSPHREKGLNQTEMAATQWGFIWLITCYPKSLGVHYATDEDLEAFCHLWRVIGYQLGMEDEYNFCQGTLEDIRQRSHDFVEYWVKPNLREITPEWEHMIRCAIAGVSVFLPGATYEICLLFLSEILDIKMPRLYASVSYMDWINHYLIKSLFCYTIKLPWVFRFANKVLNDALDRATKFTQEEIEAIRIKLSMGKDT